MDSAWLDPPAWFEPFATSLCSTVGLSPKAGQVVHLAVISCFASFALQYLSSALSPRLFPKHYPVPQAKRDDWDLHIVGWAYSLLATPLALALILEPSTEIVGDPLNGWALREARLSAIAFGYFVWDTKVTAQHISTQGLGFVAHGLACGTAYAFTLKPFLLYCGPNFLVWELSTIFLNVHWFCDKFGMTGSTLQLVNGGFLLAAYIGARLCWGTYNSFVLLNLLFGPKSDPNVGLLRYLYLAVNLGLNGLNFFWFRAMIFALKKRFVKADPNARKKAIEIDGKLRWKKEKHFEDEHQVAAPPRVPLRHGRSPATGQPYPHRARQLHLLPRRPRRVKLPLPAPLPSGLQVPPPTNPRRLGPPPHRLGPRPNRRPPLLLPHPPPLPLPRPRPRLRPCRVRRTRLRHQRRLLLVRLDRQRRARSDEWAPVRVARDGVLLYLFQGFHAVLERDGAPLLDLGALDHLPSPALVPRQAGYDRFDAPARQRRLPPRDVLWSEDMLWRVQHRRSVATAGRPAGHALHAMGLPVCELGALWAQHFVVPAHGPVGAQARRREGRQSTQGGQAGSTQGRHAVKEEGVAKGHFQRL